MQNVFKLFMEREGFLGFYYVYISYATTKKLMNIFQKKTFFH